MTPALSTLLELEELRDKVEGLESDLDSAVEVAFENGARDWVRMNYPKHYDRLVRRDAKISAIGDALEEIDRVTIEISNHPGELWIAAKIREAVAKLAPRS